MFCCVCAREREEYRMCVVVVELFLVVLFTGGRRVCGRPSIGVVRAAMDGEQNAQSEKINRRVMD